MRENGCGLCGRYADTPSSLGADEHRGELFGVLCPYHAREVRAVRAGLASALPLLASYFFRGAQ
jgi:hypothetical protein